MMQHLGDITKLDGATIKPVWCVTGGSPCQDLSIAGKRAGLAGARSGLFMEQIRVIKEMREHDKQLGWAGELIRPRYMVWENVPGALSSNKGRDFAAVLEETIRIVEPEAPGIEVPAKGWPTWGGYRDVDGRWSVAWRVHDAQYWGVPQRRRRIALVADFGGDTAHEILFERTGVSGNLEPRGEAGERPAGNAESGVNPAVARSLTARADGSPCIDRGPNIVCSPYPGGCMTPWDAQSQRVYDGNGVSPTLSSRENSGLIEPPSCAVRRLTPLECERLQGFPDGWTDIGDYTDSTGKQRKTSDSARYKALGNSIALPFWRWMFGRMAAYLPEGATLGSLFDGIGGFPLCWEDVHGAGTAIWASEIEEFPIAVTKKRFGGENMIHYTLNVEPPVEPPAYTCPRCPVCGEEVDSYYKDKWGNVVGCPECVQEVDAWTL